MKLLRFFNYFSLISAFQQQTIDAFVLRPSALKTSRSALVKREISTESSSPDQDQDVLPTIESMRVKDIQAELKQRNVSYSDCFDKESLVKRLQEARETTSILAGAGDDDSEEIVTEVLDNKDYTGLDDQQQTKSSFDRDAKLSELRGMTVRSLREECAQRRIRWAQFVEKEELVQAIIAVMEREVEYSVSGCIQPGIVADLTDDQLELELSEVSKAPLLLDIYATWCGPCQMMAPELKEAAFRLGTSMRVAKLDSDKYPSMAQRLRAGGLPTVLVLNGSEELQRIEGAMMKDQILQFVAPYAPGA